MGKSLFEFANTSNNTKKIDSKGYEKKEQKDSLNEKQIKEKVNYYSQMSKGDLMSTLFKEVSSQKANGTFNLTDLRNKIEGLKPMLTPEQVANIDMLINQIK